MSHSERADLTRQSALQPHQASFFGRTTRSFVDGSPRLLPRLTGQPHLWRT